MATKKTTRCLGCKRIISFKGPFHAGFSNQGFLYCSKDPTVLVFDSYNRYYNRIIADKHPWMLATKEKQYVEQHLKPCPCGGTFKFSNRPRCPCCGEVISNLVDSTHYVIISKGINGNKRSAWKNLGKGKGTMKIGGVPPGSN